MSLRMSVHLLVLKIISNDIAVAGKPVTLYRKETGTIATTLSPSIKGNHTFLGWALAQLNSTIILVLERGSIKVMKLSRKTIFPKKLEM